MVNIDFEPIVHDIRRCNGVPVMELLKALRMMPEQPFPSRFFHQVTEQLKLYGGEYATDEFCSGIIELRNNYVLSWLMIAADIIRNQAFLNILKDNLSKAHDQEEANKVVSFYNENVDRIRTACASIDLTRETGIRRLGCIAPLCDYLARPEEETKLQKSFLAVMKNASFGFLGVFGEGGIGKTSLVAQSIVFNDSYLCENMSITKTHITSVFWLNTFNFEVEDVYSQLALLMNIRHNDDDTVVKIIQYLDCQPNGILIVLDDIFKRDIISCILAVLRKNVYVIGISRNCNMFDSIDSTIEIGPLDCQSIENFLSKDLVLEPHQKEALSALTCGLPIVARFIRMKFRLCSGNNQEIEITCRRMLRELQDKGSTTSEHVSKLLLRGFDDETEEFRRRYYAFLLFPESFSVDVRDVAILWGLDELDAVDFAKELRLRSMARISYNSSQNSQQLTIHSLLFHAAISSATKSGRLGRNLSQVRRTLVNYPGILRQAIIKNRISLVQVICDVLREMEASSLLIAICSSKEGHVTVWELLFSSSLLDQYGIDLSLPLLCQLTEQLLIFNKKRTIRFLDLINGRKRLVETVRNGFKWFRNSLLICGHYGLTLLAELLISSNADEDSFDDENRNILIISAERRWTLLTETIIQMKPTINVNFQNKNGETALIIASRLGFAGPASKLLLSPKCNVKIRDCRGNTALHYAACAGNLDILKLLLPKFNVNDINAKNNAGESSLWLAKLFGREMATQVELELQAAGATLGEAENAFFTVITCLAAKKPYPIGDNVCYVLIWYLFGFKHDNLREHEAQTFLEIFCSEKLPVHLLQTASGNDKNNFLLFAAFLDKLSIVATLAVDFGASIEAVDKHGMTSLHWASRLNHISLLHFLIKQNANVDARDHQNNTPLMHAASWGRDNCVSVLLNSRADIEARNADTLTPLMIASKTGMKAVVSLLLKNNAHVEARDKNYWTALMIAARWNQHHVMKCLLASGANIETYDDDHWTSLLIASRWNQIQAVEVLLENHAQIEATESDKMTDLMLACRWGHDSMACLLLKRSANMNAQGKHNWTALMNAVNYNQPGIVAILLDHGADTALRAANGMTAYDFARKNGYQQIIRLFKDHTKRTAQPTKLQHCTIV